MVAYQSELVQWQKWQPILVNLEKSFLLAAEINFDVFESRKWLLLFLFFIILFLINFVFYNKSIVQRISDKMKAACQVV